MASDTTFPTNHVRIFSCLNSDVLVIRMKADFFLGDGHDPVVLHFLLAAVLVDVHVSKVLNNPHIHLLLNHTQGVVHNVSSLHISLPTRDAIFKGLIQAIQIADLGCLILEGNHTAVVLMQNMESWLVRVLRLHVDQLPILIHMNMLRHIGGILHTALSLPVAMMLPVLHAIDKAAGAQGEQQHHEEGQADAAGNAASLPLLALGSSHHAATAAVLHSHNHRGGAAVFLLWQRVQGRLSRRFFVQVYLRRGHF